LTIMNRLGVERFLRFKNCSGGIPADVGCGGGIVCLDRSIIGNGC
jgi:hypothetical protein